ncbi:MAG: 3-deoxy-manno-octulosonate cytidylyltransferase [Phycisphaerae bacterium]|nr:3-deoxy-manno-octulosonate cytidylyltransferase [Phycisphaerae bacterium]
MSCLAVIPARYASTRLPGKPLLSETGRPLVVHVADRARSARRVDRVVIATDDPRIEAAARAHGHEAVMTRADHVNGTSRVAEAVEQVGSTVEVVLNVQGDEPLVEPAAIDALVARMQGGDEPMGTVASPFAVDEDPSNPNIVKVVMDQQGRAMYFSRALIPFCRDGDVGVPVMKHVGLYAYRPTFLSRYLQLEPTPCEAAEKLEQLRVLEHGYPIAVVKAEVRHHGIDTPEQYRRFVEQNAASGG